MAKETIAKKPHYTVTSVKEFEYTGGGIWVTCGYVKDNTDNTEYFFDTSISAAWAEYINIYSEYPYEPDGWEDTEGCSFMPLPHYEEKFREVLDPETQEGKELWGQILASDAAAKTYVSSYLEDFREAINRYPSADF